MQVFRRLCVVPYKFCVEKDIKSNSQSSTLTDREKIFKQVPIPIHLRAYDAKKYEVAPSKLKINSGYAMLQIDPFPRARIMRFCYNILESVKVGIPADCIFRIYTEERIKHIMKLADQEEDIEKLEQILGFDSIELFIEKLAEQLTLIEIYRKGKLWEDADEEIDQDLIQELEMKPKPTFPKYKKPERKPSQFVD